jgi:hypothetical protein
MISDQAAYFAPFLRGSHFGEGVAFGVIVEKEKE